jgi:dihydrofolate synthase/folylpolyglutamate synthase
VVEGLIAAGEIDMHTTYFETVTAMAFVLFRERGCERVVLEVGMGGRLDATNVVLPELCVITPVEFDHQTYLGDTLEQIAGEKAGILKPGVPVILSPQRSEAASVLEARAGEVGAPLEHAAMPEAADVSAEGSRLVIGGLAIECPLRGLHQVENAATAVAALRKLGVGDPEIRAGVKATRWPARLELVGREPDFYVDGAHNPAGARRLLEYIRRFHGGRTVWMIFGAMRDKAVSEIAGILFPAANEIVLTAPDQKRALEPDAIREFAPAGARVIPRVADAVAAVRREASPGDVVFLTGSLYLAGEARALLVQ